MTFLENIGGFLFRPYRRSRIFLEDPAHTYRKTLIFVLYCATILSIIQIFFILYPEGLWYGISTEVPFRGLTLFNVYTPIVILLFFLIFWGAILGMHFLGVGVLNYYIGRLFSHKNPPSRTRKEYLTVFGFSSILPILVLGVVAIFWMYFFEKLYFASDVSPYLDFTAPTIIFFCILFGCMGWKWIIETRVNQAFFNTSILRAVIPEIVQVFLLLGYFFLFGFIMGIFTSGVRWV